MLQMVCLISYVVSVPVAFWGVSTNPGLFGNGWVQLVWAVWVSINFFFYSTTFQGWVLLAGARLTGEGCHVTVLHGRRGRSKVERESVSSGAQLSAP